ncbi:cytochrome P450 [Colletotrichum lupini]|nr:cytochrome P450 [Colletotrichum lupini]
MLLLLDPRAVYDIYGHGANFFKDARYDGGAGEFRHMSDESIKAKHQRKRKSLAHVFAPKSFSEQEPVIAETIRTLMTQLRKHAQDERPVNMRRYFNYFTIDAFLAMLYGSSLNSLKRNSDIVNAETPGRNVYQVPFIQSLLHATQINTVLGMEAGLLPLTRKFCSWHPYKKAGADFDNIILHCTKARFASKDKDGDIFQKLMAKNNGEPVNLPFGELLAECSVMMNAGTETTTAALTNAVYFIYTHPNNTVLSYDAIGQLPFLKACVEESLRVRPASSMGLPRALPEGGRVIAGQFVSEGVTVSVPTYTLLRDVEAFKDAETFRPQRWIDGNKEKMLKVHLPFNTGPRACIGRNIAYFEQLMLISSLVRNFDFPLASPGHEFRALERFDSNPDELFLLCRLRDI